MQLLRPSARQVYRAETEGRVAIGGIHTRAAARAMGVMHVNGGMGVVCAAPTAGSAGVIPGVVVTLAEERGLSQEQAALALLAAFGVTAAQAVALSTLMLSNVLFVGAVCALAYLAPLGGTREGLV